MSDGEEMKKRYASPRRFSSPEDEKLHPWLSMLLDAFHVIDKGIAASIKREAKGNRTVACFKGCSSCCKTHHTVPVYPLELVGISWYVTEKISGPEREVLKKHLREHTAGEPCPFLVNGSCSVHAVRPIACRQFMVFSHPCIEGEDPYYTRRKDVLSPLKEYLDEAFYIMMPFYGVKEETERRKAAVSGALHKVVRLIQECNWKTLADTMDAFDKEKNAAPS
jgi:Fe-S-cluster containining protein